MMSNNFAGGMMNGTRPMPSQAQIPSFGGVGSPPAPVRSTPPQMGNATPMSGVPGQINGAMMGQPQIPQQRIGIGAPTPQPGMMQPQTAQQPGQNGFNSGFNGPSSNFGMW
jgi:hypothetical protein